jgi:hypothetical protein
MRDLVANFAGPSVQLAPRPISAEEVRSALKDPENLLTYEIARAMAEDRRTPYGYAAAMASDGRGFVAASHDGQKVSMFLKPDDTKAGAFWEIDTTNNKMSRSPALAGYLAENYSLYGAVYQCITKLQQDGDDRISMIAVNFAQDFASMRDAPQAERTHTLK